MSVQESYIDRCVAAAESIDVEALSQLELGAEVGRGNLFSMRQLGALSVLGSQMHSGLKVPTKGLDHASIRLQQELDSIELLLNRMPEYAAKIPQFMTLLAIEGHEIPVAILTEDASKGGELSVMGLGSLMGISDRASSIGKAFKHVDGTRVDTSAIDHSFAFWVGEEERFLDFTPPPVRRTGSLWDNPTADHIYDLIESNRLTITISAESSLSRSLPL